MQIQPHVEALHADLAAVAAVGGPDASETVQRIAAALEASLRLRVLEIATEAAHELTPQLPAGHVEVRLAGGEPSLAYVEEAPAAAMAAEDAFTARITLRLPESLKASVEIAATRAGLSVNAWLVQALARSVDPRSSWGSRPSRSGRLTGFARS